MDITEVSILHHVGIVLIGIWVLSAYNWCHSVVYFLALIYLYLVRINHCWSFWNFWIFFVLFNFFWLCLLFCFFSFLIDLLVMWKRKKKFGGWGVGTGILWWILFCLFKGWRKGWGIILLCLWLSSFCFFFGKVHERYVTRLRKKLQFEERKQANQRRVILLVLAICFCGSWSLKGIY